MLGCTSTVWPLRLDKFASFLRAVDPRLMAGVEAETAREREIPVGFRDLTAVCCRVFDRSAFDM